MGGIMTMTVLAGPVALIGSLVDTSQKIKEVKKRNKELAEQLRKIN